MKNLFKIAFVALAFTAFTACGNQEGATEAEVTETEVTETEAPAEATEEVVVDSAAVVAPADSTVTVQ